MDAIACAVDVTARDSLVALHNIKLLLLPQFTCGMSKTTLAADAAPLSRIANVDMPVVLLFSLPFTGDDIQLKILVA